MNTAIDPLGNDFLDDHNRQITIKVQLPQLKTLNNPDALFEALTN